MGKMWMKVRLGDYIQEYSVRNRAEEDIPVYSVTNTNGFCTGYFDKEVASKDRSTYKIVPKGYFAYNPSRINVGSIDWQRNQDRVIVSPLYVVFSTSSEILPQYLYYFLKSKVGLSYIQTAATGSVRDNLKFSMLQKFPIVLRSIPEQQIIIQILDCIQKRTSHYKQQLENFDTLIKARFIEMFGDPNNNEKNWKVNPLGKHMTTLTDFNANGSYEMLDSNVVMFDEPNYAIMVRTIDLESGNLETGVKYIDQRAYELLSKSMLFGGELIMNKIGSAGKIYIMPKINHPASLGRNAFMFRFDDQINMTFLYNLLTTDYGEKEIQQHVRGAVTKTITKDATRAIRIIVPPIDLQEQYANFVAQVDKSKAVVQQALAKDQLLFDSLMQQYFG